MAMQRGSRRTVPLRSLTAFFAKITLPLLILQLNGRALLGSRGDRYPAAVAMALEDGAEDMSCYYEFPAKRTIFGLKNRVVADYGGVVLSPGNVLAVIFSDIPYPAESPTITGMKVFVVSSFHTSTITSVEMAIVGNEGLITPQATNASDIESTVPEKDWTSTKVDPFGEHSLWESCRYYEVGAIKETAMQEVFSKRGHRSKRSGGDKTTDIEVLLRHGSGQTAFIEGNNQTYINNFVLQVRSECGWDLQEQGSSSYPTSSMGSYYGDSGFSGIHHDESEEPIRDGQRHPLCGGVYLNSCQLGAYSASDVGDGSCQQHLNTAACHFDGGDCCSASCTEAGSTSDTAPDKPYDCQEAGLDPYHCKDPTYVMDFTTWSNPFSSASRLVNRSVWSDACLAGVGCDTAVAVALAMLAGMVMASLG